MKSIHEALMEVQSKLKAPKAEYNNFGKYHYRTTESILEAVKPLLYDNGLHLTLNDKPILIGDRFYVEATASISNGNNALSVSGFARESDTKKGMDDSQITGAASSYARKRALSGLFLLDDARDSDVTNASTGAAEDLAKDIISRVNDAKDFEDLNNIMLTDELEKLSNDKKKALFGLMLSRATKVGAIFDKENKQFNPK